MPLEPGQAVLGRQVGGAVDRRDVLEDGRLDGGVGQRVGLHPHLDGAGRRGRQRHGEVLPVDLVAVGQHRHEVAPVRQRQPAPGREVGLVPLGVDRARSRDAGDRGPQARGGIARARRAAPVGRGPLRRDAGVVDVDDVLEGRDGRGSVGGAHHLEGHGLLRLGRRGRGGGEDRDDEQTTEHADQAHGNCGDPVHSGLHGSLAGVRPSARRSTEPRHGLAGSTATIVPRSCRGPRRSQVTPAEGHRPRSLEGRIRPGHAGWRVDPPLPCLHRSNPSSGGASVPLQRSSVAASRDVRGASFWRIWNACEGASTGQDVQRPVRRHEPSVPALRPPARRNAEALLAPHRRERDHA